MSEDTPVTTDETPEDLPAGEVGQLARRARFTVFFSQTTERGED